MVTINKERYLVLSYLFKGRWVEARYSLDDPEWRIAVQTLCETGSKFKLHYLQ
jgi:hypothetical protein